MRQLQHNLNSNRQWFVRLLWEEFERTAKGKPRAVPPFPRTTDLASRGGCAAFFHASQKRRPEDWILKLNVHLGHGVTFLTDFQPVHAACNATQTALRAGRTPSPVIIQEVVKPHLLNGRQYVMRAWLLLRMPGRASPGAAFHMWGRTYPRVCTEPYAARHNKSLRLFATTCNADLAYTTHPRMKHLLGQGKVDEFYDTVMPPARKVLGVDLYRRGGIPEMLRLIASAVFRRYRLELAAEEAGDGDEEDRWDMYGVDYMLDTRRRPKILELNNRCAGGRQRQKANITDAQKDAYDDGPYRHEMLRIVMTHFLRGDPAYNVSACEAELEIDRLPVE